MTSKQWVQAFARQTGMEAPDDDQFEAILRLAAIAAHASERTAAPVACWLAGTSGRPLAELIEAAEAVGAEAEPA